jgi:hypothetical protein
MTGRGNPCTPSILSHTPRAQDEKVSVAVSVKLRKVVNRMRIIGLTSA